METEKNILRVIAYFDMFHYPVSAVEIHRFSNMPAAIEEIESVLLSLVERKKVFGLDEFYSLQNDHSLVDRRREGNEKANRLLHVASRIGKILSRFPFVRGIGISGSLSKNYADEQADIDFFIITQANRLWIARSLLHCLKKLSFLFGKQHWYCMNYFIDEEALLVAEKNIFIATEVVTLKPIFGNMTMNCFFAANDWAFAYFPNYQQDLLPIDPAGKSWIKKMMESLFDNAVGVWLDNYLMQVTEKRWLQKERKHKLNIKGELLSLRISKHFARPNPEHFQKKILMLYDEKLKKIEAEWGIDLTGQPYFLHKEMI